MTCCSFTLPFSWEQDAQRQGSIRNTKPSSVRSIPKWPWRGWGWQTEKPWAEWGWETCAQLRWMRTSGGNRLSSAYPKSNLSPLRIRSASVIISLHDTNDNPLIAYLLVSKSSEAQADFCQTLGAEPRSSKQPRQYILHAGPLVTLRQYKERSAVCRVGGYPPLVLQVSSPIWLLS